MSLLLLGAGPAVDGGGGGGFPIIGVNIRSTLGGPSGFTGDSSGFTYAISGDLWSAPASRGAFANIGYEGADPTTNAASGANEHVAGLAILSAGAQLINFEPTDAGVYNVWAMLGNPGATVTSAIRMYKGAGFGTTLTTTANSSKPAGQYEDLNGVLHASYAAFMANATPFSVDLSTGSKVLSFGKSPTASGNLCAVWMQRTA